MAGSTQSDYNNNIHKSVSLIINTKTVIMRANILTNYFENKYTDRLLHHDNKDKGTFLLGVTNTVYKQSNI